VTSYFIFLQNIIIGRFIVNNGAVQKVNFHVTLIRQLTDVEV